ncbi:MAG: ribonuclease E/G [Pseudomonadota bacterium]
MTRLKFSKIFTHKAPGETRAVLVDNRDRACNLLLERWKGDGAPARHGNVYAARLRAFAEAQGGAFLDLETGEQVFLRLTSRDGLTEGMALTVEVKSEARQDKLARVSLTEAAPRLRSAFETWVAAIPEGVHLPQYEDAAVVETAFEEALSPTITLPNGGHLHVDRTRALTAFDIDTSGRITKGSAGARALSITREAVHEVARQVSLRGLGGILVLDCLSPLNREAGEQIQKAARSAFQAYEIKDANVLRPSPLGLLEVSLPWRVTPLADRLAADPAETHLLTLFRQIQREAVANPTALFTLALCKSTWTAYLNRRNEANHDLEAHFGGRVMVAESETDKDEIRSR